MASRAKRVSSWREPLENVARARRFAEQFGIPDSHPSDFLDPLPPQEHKEWDDLLKRI